MNGYLMAFVSMIAASVSTFPFTDAARKWGPVAINHFRLITAFIVVSILVMILDKKNVITLFTTPTGEEYVYLIVSGIIGLVVGDYFGFHCMAIAGAKRFSIFNTISPGAALGFSFILIGERIDFIGIIGIFISIAGMLWFNRASNTKEIDEHVVHEHGNMSKGFLFGMLSALCQGFHITISKKALSLPVHSQFTIHHSPLISPVHATWIRFLGATLAYFIYTLLRGKFREKVIHPICNDKTIIFKSVLATIFGLVVSVVLVMWSITLCKVAIVQTIISLSPIVIMPLAYVFYHEKMTYQTFFAGIISVLGVYVLIWRDEIASFFDLHLH